MLSLNRHKLCTVVRKRHLPCHCCSPRDNHWTVWSVGTILYVDGWMGGILQSGTTKLNENSINVIAAPIKANREMPGVLPDMTQLFLLAPSSPHWIFTSRLEVKNDDSICSAIVDYKEGVCTNCKDVTDIAASLYIELQTIPRWVARRNAVGS